MRENKKPGTPSLLRLSWIFWIIFRVGGSKFHEESWKCSAQLSSRTLTLPIDGRVYERAVEIHIRSTVKTELELRDGSRDEDDISVDLEMSHSEEAVHDNLITNYSWLYEDQRRAILIIQLEVSRRIVERNLSVLYVCGGILICSLCVVVVVYLRRKSEVNRTIISFTSREPLHHSAPESEELNEGRTVDAEENDTMITSDSCSTTSHTKASTKQTAVLDVDQPDSERGVTRAVDSRPRGVRGGGLGRTELVLSVVVVSLVTVVWTRCDERLQIRAVLSLPPHLHYTALLVFTVGRNQMDIDLENWSQLNNGSVRVFDIKDASSSLSSSSSVSQCSVNLDCPHANDVTVCDLVTSRCVCSHGYAFSGERCQDIDECAVFDGFHCPKYSICINSIGHYSCACTEGFYMNDLHCEACSDGCPTGTYLLKACSHLSDRICSACSECDSESYELHACTTSSDRVCIHAGHPVDKISNTLSPAYIEGLRVEVSENIVPENLHDTRNLETTFYVTDLTQASDFYWERESGIGVNIGILDVHLIPEYWDVEYHGGDNSFILSNPNNNEDKAKYQNILQNFCRYPIPDYYSLTLEISRDRATAARGRSCDSLSESCSAGHSPYGQDLTRTLNDACIQMGAFPEPLMPAANSIVCTESGAWLQILFNQSSNPERPIRFPKEKCPSAISRCEQCLNQARCVSLEFFEKQCCQVDCYILADCKIAFSKMCSEAPVECAMGDAYRYTLHPMFQSLQSDVHCHIRRRPMKVLYELFFFIQYPKRRFQTSKVYHRVRAGDDVMYSSSGVYLADYLTVEHNTGLKLNDDVTLRRQQKETGVNMTIYKLLPIQENHDFKSVHKISENIYVSTVQFERPFDYSTSTWVDEMGMEAGGCNKNITKFRTSGRHYDEREIGQPVTAIIQNIAEPYRYFIKSQNSPPYIRFTVPGNFSILPYYFKSSGPRLILDSSLIISSSFVTGKSYWRIDISGRMTGCPAYLGVTVGNPSSEEEIFNYDFLIFCPVEFNVSFSIPNYQLDSSLVTFSVKLSDPSRSYQVYLTHLLSEPHSSPQHLQDQMSAAEEDEFTVLLTVAGVIAACLAVVFLSVYVYMEVIHTRASITNDNRQWMYSYSFRNGPDHHECEIGSNNVDATPSLYHDVEKLATKPSLLLTLVYVTLWVLYSLSFTFSLLFLVISLLTEADVKILSNTSSIQNEQRLLSRNISAEMNNFVNQVQNRHQKKILDMQLSCNNYLTERYQGTLKVLSNSVESWQQNSSLSKLMHTLLSKRIGRYQDKLHEFSLLYRHNITATIVKVPMKNYKQYLKSLFHNNWLKFAQKIFNSSLIELRTASAYRSLNLLRTESEFGIFLEMEDVESVLLWPIRTWERYQKELPRIPMPPYINLTDIKSPDCTFSTEAEQNIGKKPVDNRLFSRLSLLDRLNTNKFIISLPFDLSSDDDSSYYDITNQHVETSRRTEAKDELLKEGSTVEFLDSNSRITLRILFVVIDIIIIVNRMSVGYFRCVNLLFNVNKTDNKPKTNHHKTNGSAGLYENHHRGEIEGSDRRKIIAHRFVSRVKRHESNSVPSLDCGNHVAKSYNDWRYDNVSIANSIHQENINKLSTNTRKHVIIQACLDNLVVPKFVLCLVLLLLSYVLSNLATTYLDVTRWTEHGAFRMMINGILSQSRLANHYAIDEVRHLNDVIIDVNKLHMMSDLTSLQGLVDYFILEQKRIWDNYIREACVIKGDEESDCDTTINLSTIDLQLMPCNFIPLQQQQYTEVQLNVLRTKLIDLIRPYITALRSTVMTCVCTVLITLVSSFIIHIICFILLRNLDTTHTKNLDKTTVAQEDQNKRNRSTRDEEGEDWLDDNGEAGLDYGFDDCDDLSSDHFVNQEQNIEPEIPISRGQTEFTYTETKV